MHFKWTGDSKSVCVCVSFEICLGCIPVFHPLTAGMDSTYLITQNRLQISSGAQETDTNYAHFFLSFSSNFVVCRNNSCVDVHAMHWRMLTNAGILGNIFGWNLTLNKVGATAVTELSTFLHLIEVWSTFF